MSEWFETLDGLRDAAWRRLAGGPDDATGPLRTLSLSTVDADGHPAARTVIVRAADREAARLDVHTDLSSSKVAELRGTPRAALLSWDPETALQVRLSAHAEVLSGEVVAPIWSRVPDTARRNYGGTPPPGTPLHAPGTYEETIDRDRFAVLRFHVETMEVLHLGTRHRRAVFGGRGDGRWIAP
ncbi:Pyridoxamine 5'-phosphate oxidase [Tranquillimonas rosea]|uniref:Pyridoxamine 5'-phosphate oxidase n=1 Tax=Tranquillimonas rosea TaxID=641238 RepID=A0A1H9Q823_9RHOB|nr:pyridoxamine 5'-phosphate oxidase family protein [Tranquillimonas rosea]SER56594.1 Pyridoxamine 5'-phosphate oxidase [Tranquillimonas rosea]